MKDDSCSLCGSSITPGDTGVLMVGGLHLTQEYYFCFNCSPSIKRYVSVHGPNFFPSGFHDLLRKKNKKVKK